MPHWEYKTVFYAIEGKYTHSLRFWADASGKRYGPEARSSFLGGISRQLSQFEGALQELDREGWEVVSMSIWTAFPGTRQGCALLRRASED